jgi:hypothetical protein
MRIAIAISLTIGVASISESKQPDLFSLPMEHFRDTATVKDDPLDTSVTVTTENGLLRVVNFDQFFRGFVDKKTGVETIQIYEWINYDGDWRFYETANYETATGPESTKVDSISRELLGCSTTLGCTHVEHMAFMVPEALLRAEAAKYQPGQKSGVWLFRLNAKSGVEFKDGFTYAEIAGFLAKLDEISAKYRPAPQ